MLSVVRKKDERLTNRGTESDSEQFRVNMSWNLKSNLY